MRTLQLFLLVLGGLLTSATLCAQVEPDRGPHFVGRDFTDYATWKLIYPDSLLQTDTPGEATCYLSVDSTGYVFGERIEASHPLFESAARQLLDGVRNWEPAWKNGKPVAGNAVVRTNFDPATYRHRIKWQEQKLEACEGQKVDSEPVFPDEIRRIVMGNMKWPDNSRSDTAIVVCRFTVTPSGYIENVRVEKGGEPGFTNEALSIVYGFPLLIAARRNGKAVPFDYRLTIHFRIDDYNWYRTPVNKERNDIFADYLLSPEFPGGMVKLLEFLKGHIRITPEIRETGIQGRVTCSFMINADGSLEDFEVVCGIHPLHDAEALRVLKSMPRWRGSTTYGFTKRPYRIFKRIRYAIPVAFKW